MSQEMTQTVQVCCLAIAAILLSGCTVPYAIPEAISDFEDAGKMDLVVALRITDEFRGAEKSVYDHGVIRKMVVGDLFARNSENMANALFSKVVVVKDNFSLEESNVDAVLTPKLLSIEENRPMTIYGEMILTIVVEWTMKDSSGSLVWVETSTGEGRSPMGSVFTGSLKENGRDRIRQASEAIFKEVHQSILSSIDIKRLSEKN